jgi:hypothetical protein
MRRATLLLLTVRSRARTRRTIATKHRSVIYCSSEGVPKGRASEVPGSGVRAGPSRGSSAVLPRVGDPTSEYCEVYADEPFGFTYFWLIGNDSLTAMEAAGQTYQQQTALLEQKRGMALAALREMGNARARQECTAQDVHLEAVGHPSRRDVGVRNALQGADGRQLERDRLSRSAKRSTIASSHALNEVSEA